MSRDSVDFAAFGVASWFVLRALMAKAPTLPPSRRARAPARESATEIKGFSGPCGEQAVYILLARKFDTRRLMMFGLASFGLRDVDLQLHYPRVGGSGCAQLI
jgi:hypothetical protein